MRRIKGTIDNGQHYFQFGTAVETQHITDQVK